MNIKYPLTFKAAILERNNEPLVIDNVTFNGPLQPGQVLVKIHYSGICGKQIEEIKGTNPDPFLPHMLGHEGSGEVVDIGLGIKKVSIGDYVVLHWLKGSGIDAPTPEYLRNGKKINAGQITTFNEYCIISENRVMKIPKELPSAIAALFGCAVPTGVGIVKNELKAKKGDSLAIFGIGGIGACILLSAVAAGVSPIIAVDINHSKLMFAKENGAIYVLNSAEEDIVAKIKEITQNKGLDYSVDCTGKSAIMEAAFDVINYNGTVIIAGNPAYGEKISIAPSDLIKGKKIFGSWGGKTNPDRDIPHYAKRYLDGELKFDKLISKIYPFDKINEAIKDLEKGKIICRALVKF